MVVHHPWSPTREEKKVNLSVLHRWSMNHLVVFRGIASWPLEVSLERCGRSLLFSTFERPVPTLRFPWICENEDQE